MSNLVSLHNILLALLSLSNTCLVAQNMDSLLIKDSILVEYIQIEGQRIHRFDNIINVPISRTTITPIPRLDQLLNSVSGVEMQFGALNTNRINIRGIGSRSPFSTSKLKAYLDDIPLTDGAGETSIEDFNLQIIEQLQVIKGPNSSLYGSTLGGTIILRSSWNKPAYSNQTQLTYGSFGNKRINSNHHIDWDSNQKTFFNLSHQQSSGYRENNQYRNSSGYLFHKTQTNNGLWSFFLQGVKLRSEIPSSINLIDYTEDPRRAAGNWADVAGYEDNFKSRFGLSYQHTINNTTSLSSTVFGSYFNNYELRPFNVLDDDVDRIGFRSRISFQQKKYLHVLGVETSRENYRWKIFDTVDGMQGPIEADNQSIRQEIQFFGQSQYNLGTFTIIGGLNAGFSNFSILYSLVNRSTDRRFPFYLNPRMAVSQEISETTGHTLSLSRGQVLPSLDELIDPQGQFITDLNPENGWNLEYRIHYTSSKITLTSTLFYLQVSDILVNRQDQNGESFALNAGSTIHRGWETELNSQLLSNGNHQLSWSGTWSLGSYRFDNFISNSDFSGNSLTGVAPKKWHSDLEYQYRSLSVRYRYQWRDAIPINDGNSIFSESYGIHSIFINQGIGMGNKKIDVSFSLDNILDKKYASMVSVNPSTFGGRPPRYLYPGLPRNFQIAVMVHY